VCERGKYETCEREKERELNREKYEVKLCESRDSYVVVFGKDNNKINPKCFNY
jgi:hypothetical protein